MDSLKLSVISWSFYWNYHDLWPFIDPLLEENVTKTAKSKIVPASACAIWYQGRVKFEQLDGKTGLKHGTSKKAQSKGRVRQSSDLFFLKY